VRLSDDSKYVVFLDRQDNSLHVVHLDPVKWSVRQVASCFTHAQSGARLTLRCGGRVAAINDDSQRICLLAIAENADCHDDEQVDYTSERNRAVSILAACRQRQAANQPTLELKHVSEDAQKICSLTTSVRPLSNTKDLRTKLTPLADIIRTPSAADILLQPSI